MATLQAAPFTWDGGNGNWSDANWNTGNSLPDTDPSGSYVSNGDDINISSGSVDADERILFDNGTLTISAGASITVDSTGSLSSMNLGSAGSAGHLVVTGSSSASFIGSGGSGRSVRAQNGSSISITDSTLNISSTGDNGSIEMESGTTISIAGTSNVTMDYLRLDSTAAGMMTMSGGVLTLTDENPLRADVPFSAQFNLTGAVGSTTIIHTDLSGDPGSRHLAGKLAGPNPAFFAIDGNAINPTTEYDGTNLAALNAELASSFVFGGRFIQITESAGQQTLILTDTPVGSGGSLTTTVIPSFPSPTLAENPNPTTNLGATTIAAGNSKGQSFSLPASATLDSFVFEIDSVATTGDYTLEIYAAMDGLPYLLTPIFSDSGTLPAGLTTGDLIQIGLDSPFAVDRGSYLVALTGLGGTSFDLVITNDDNFTQGAGARNNGSTNGWESFTTAVSDTVFGVLGTLDTLAPTAPVGAPNIVFIMADDLGWTDLSIGVNGPNYVDGVDHGSAYYETPNIKGLAEEGLSFVNCYAQPNCAPTRAAILSGQYPPRDGNGVYHVDNLNRGRNSPSFGSPPQFVGPPQNEDIPANHLISTEVLQDGGYVTAHVGKYHVGNHEGGSTTMPENQGFDFNFGGKQTGNPGNYFSNNQTFNGALGPGLQSYAKNYTSSYITDNLTPFANGNNPSSLLPSDPDKFVQDGIADAAVAFINDHSNGAMSSRPFYLQLHAYAVHTPIGNSQSRPDLLSKFQAITSTDPRHDSAPYAAILENLDHTVGRVLQSLVDNGQASNTIVMFTSDNGGHIGATDNDPIRFRKGSHYDGGLRVPLIVRWPAQISGAEQGTQSESLVHSVDFFPTFIEAAGLSMPTQNAVGDPVNYDGTSFLAHAMDTVTNPRNRETIFYHFPGYLDERSRPCEVAIKRIDGIEYKMIYTYDLTYVGNQDPNGSNEHGTEGLDILSDHWEFYNLTEDISETNDLLDGSYSNWLLYGDIATEMAEEIEAWLNNSEVDWNPSQVTDGGSPVSFLDPANIPAVTVPFSQVFRIDSSTVDTGSNEITLGWPSEAGFNYRIEVSDNLGSWATIVASVASEGAYTDHTFPDPDIATETKRFYRVVLLP